VPDFKLRRSEKMPSSNFFEFLTGRPKAWNLKDKHLTMSVPEMWKRLFLMPVRLCHGEAKEEHTIIHKKCIRQWEARSGGLLAQDSSPPELI